MPGHVPKLKIAAKSLYRRREILAAIGSGESVFAVAVKMDLSPQAVRAHLHKALEAESLYPHGLTTEEIAHLRQLQAEILSTSRQKALETQATVNARIGTAKEKSGDAQAVARLLEAVTRAVDLEANLFGTRQPTKIVEESMRIQLTKVDGEIRVKCDGSGLRPRWTPLGEVDCKGERYDQVVLPPRPRQPALENQE